MQLLYNPKMQLLYSSEMQLLYSSEMQLLYSVVPGTLGHIMGTSAPSPHT